MPSPLPRPTPSFCNRPEFNWEDPWEVIVPLPAELYSQTPTLPQAPGSAAQSSALSSQPPQL